MPGTRTAAPDSTSTAATTAMPTSNRPIYNSDCPALNNTVYYVPGSTKTFRRYCGIDYSAGNDGATELAYAWYVSLFPCTHPPAEAPIWAINLGGRSETNKLQLVAVEHASPCFTNHPASNRPSPRDRSDIGAANANYACRAGRPAWPNACIHVPLSTSARLAHGDISKATRGRSTAAI
jgi:hypothetical protein